MNDLVLIVDGVAMTTSKLVADKFKKTHRQVLRDIREVIKALPDDFGSSNFMLSSYTSEQNKVLPCYKMTRDGFAILCMGFTGKPAMEWKVKYLSAFNKMEQELISQSSENKGSLMEALSHAIKLMEKDRDIASAYGKGLSQWKKLRVEHMEKVIRLHKDTQLVLGFQEIKKELQHD